MDGTWLTYAEAAARLNSTVGGIRKRAARGRWARQAGNDGRARVLVPDETSMGRPTPVRVDMVSTVSALQAHIETLKVELAASEARVDKVSAELAVEREQLAAARAAADRATAELVALAQRLAALAEERSKLEAIPEPPRHWVVRAWRWSRGS